MSTGRIIAGLGAGIALGTLFGFYALAPNVEGGPGGGSASAQHQLEQERSARQSAEADANTADQIIDAQAQTLLADDLKGRTVALVRMPGAPAQAVDRIAAMVGDAGGEVSARVTLTEEAVNPDKGDELKSLAANSLPAGAKLSEKNLNPGMHTGQILGAALSSGRGPGAGKSASESDRSIVFGALGNQGFVDKADQQVKPADLAIVVTGSGAHSTAGKKEGNREDGSPAGGGYAAQFTADVAAGLDSTMAGTVLAGDAGSAADGGAIAIIRKSPELVKSVSTVDDAQRAAGALTVIKAAKQQLERAAGQYGSGPGATAATVG
ncbi:copper transporter [Corynebacterium heidelbergense]|uniref:Copper transporter n=1 Tax=Corynebacterium heidelbergense TaxID=2055947 RepID=A0A364V4W0_9CORY|nr:copper transporter [Corynebacterium heidelbergense]RAV31659.1 copper transporter [Corynebacterium heidelbergense]